jgi:hypothetical protein
VPPVEEPVGGERTFDLLTAALVAFFVGLVLTVAALLVLANVL